MYWSKGELRRMGERVSKLEEAVNWLVHHELYGGNVNEAPAYVKELCGKYADNATALMMITPFSQI